MRYESYKKVDLPWLKEIPSHWEISKVKNVCSNFYSGGTPDSGNEKYYTDEVENSFLNISDLKNRKRISTTKKHLTHFGVKSKNLQLVKAGSIVYAMYASVGKVAILDKDMYISQAFLSFECDETVDTDFLYYTLKNMERYVHIYTNSSTQSNLNAQQTKNIPVLLPPKEEQEQIADLLDKTISIYDENISIIDLKIKKLELLKQSLISDVVTGVVDIRGIEIPTYERVEPVIDEELDEELKEEV